MGMEEDISNRLMTPRGVIEDLSKLLPNTGATVWGLLIIPFIGAIHEGRRGMGLFTRNALGYCSLWRSHWERDDGAQPKLNITQS